MLHVILIILKILGIVLLSIIGIILLITLIVLIMPIRYRLNASYYQSINIEAKVYWILRLFGIDIKYVSDDLSIKLRILFFTIYDNKREKKPKKENKVKKIKDNKSEKSYKATKEDIKIKQIEEKSDTKDSTFNSNISESQEEKVNSNEKKEIYSEMTVNDITRDEISENEALIHEIPINKVEKENPVNETDLSAPMINSKTKKQRKNIFVKIKDFFVNIINKIKNIFNRIINTFKNIKNNIDLLKQKLNSVIEFIKDEDNKTAMKKIYLSIKKILKHILPQKIKINSRFGTNDPATTGQILGVISLLIPFFKNSIHVIPDFENQVLEGNLFVKGRIRLISLVIIGVKLLLNKQIIKFIKKIRNAF